MSIKFDGIDLQILQDLQEDGRLTNVELARRAGISAPPCLRRVRVLEENGVIKGYHANINPNSLGYNVTIFAEVGLISQTDTDLQSFMSHINRWPLVRECYMLAGDADFLLKIVAHDWDEYQTFLSEELTKIVSVKNFKSKLVIKATKDLPGIPIT